MDKDDNANREVRRSSRKPEMTERGNAYELDLLSKRVKKVSSGIHRTIESLDEAVMAGNRESTREEARKLDTLTNEMGSLGTRLETLRGSDALIHAVKDAELAATTAQMSVLRIKSDKVGTSPRRNARASSETNARVKGGKLRSTAVGSEKGAPQYLDPHPPHHR